MERRTEAEVIAGYHGWIIDVTHPDGGYAAERMLIVLHRDVNQTYFVHPHWIEPE